MKKLLILILLVVALMTAGCSGTDAPAEEIEQLEVNETVQIVENETAEDVAEEPVGVPELKIMSVTATQTGLDIAVKNIGNETAKSVYCGVLAFRYNNRITFRENMTFDELHGIMIPSVLEGVTGETHFYETNYSYKDTPNLTIVSELVSIDYLGNVPEEEALKGETNFYSDSYVDEYWKIAWMEGDEENYVVY